MKPRSATASSRRASLPENDEAVENWQCLREMLLSSGFRQTTLTNFERSELADDPRRYRYEPISFQSNRCHVLGFGPAGISYSQSPDRSHALKTMNPESSAEYIRAVHAKGTTWNRYFQYQPHDLELLFFTRRLAALRIEKDSLSRDFGPSVWDRYSGRFDVLESEGLLERARHGYSLTPRGMFFSDSIAALLADQRWDLGGTSLRTGPFNDNGKGFM